jgi:hypothetical protein
LYRLVPEELSWNEWVAQPRALWLPPIKRPLGLALLSLATLAGGLWLVHPQPSKSFVAGKPVAVSLNGNATTADTGFISLLVSDLNSSEPCPSYGCVGTSLGNCSVREDTLRFQYENDDRLTVLVRSGCGRIFAIAENPPGPAMWAKENVVTDLANWPGTQ